MTASSIISSCYRLEFTALVTLLLMLVTLSNGAETRTQDMVVAPHPLATAAGEEILRLGGTAVDAVVAIQSVLGLVEPQSSGLGGGAFCIYYDAATGETLTFDGREKAPAAATEDRFAALPNFFAAWQSGLSVGVPGVPRLMEHMHQRFGQLEWKSLFVSGQKLATEGFALTERTSAAVQTLLDFNNNCSERLFFRDPASFEYFVDTVTCTAKPAGTKMTNEAYYETLTALANDGADAFYTGVIADDIVAAVQGDLAIPGDTTSQDMASYEVVEREPVCFEYRGKEICGMGPPSSGGLAVGQMLGIIEELNTSSLDPFDPLNEQAVHWFSQANRLAFADRGMFSADSDFVHVPIEGMLDKDYLSSRADLIGEKDMGIASPGVPPGENLTATGADFRTKHTGTSHVSIVDRYGNALSYTTSIEAPFGNGVMVHGFLLNNELTDFSFAPVDADGKPIANRVEANKRPRSSMSPTIVFNSDGSVKLLTGSPGGSRIIGYTAQSIWNVLEFGLDPQDAIEVPHYQNNNVASTDIERSIPDVTRDYDVAELSENLMAHGHEVTETELNSGLAVILLTEEGDLMGGADKRRDVSVGGSDFPRSETTSSGSVGGSDYPPSVITSSGVSSSLYWSGLLSLMSSVPAFLVLGWM